MASGKKNYFRHATGAFEDQKIQRAISLLGYEGYAYFFILIEVLAKQCENEFKNPIRIHKQTLKNVWRKQAKSCDKVLTKLEESGLFVVTKWSESDYKVDTFLKSLYEIDIPNLAKYMGKYESKYDPNSPNKRKEKENKRKESKEKENSTAEFEQFSIPDKLMQDLKILESYPEKIICEVAKEAWLLYNASEDKGKNWHRFSAAYFKNEKQKIRERILNDPDEARERLIKKYEGSEYEF